MVSNIYVQAGKRGFSVDTLMRLADALDVDYTYILSENSQIDVGIVLVEMEDILEKNYMELKRKIAQLKRIFGKNSKQNVETREKIERLMKEVDISYEDMYEHPNDKEVLLLKEYNSNLMQSDINKGKGEIR